MDWLGISEGYEDMTAAFRDIQVDSVRVIGVETDFLWPSHQQTEICKMFTARGVNCHMEMLPSLQGHDSFMADYKRFCPAVEQYLRNLE